MGKTEFSCIKIRGKQLRITAQPHSEGTSTDYYVQPDESKGSLDEIISHPFQLHLENLQHHGDYCHNPHFSHCFPVLAGAGLLESG